MLDLLIGKQITKKSTEPGIFKFPNMSLTTFKNTDLSVLINAPSLSTYSVTDLSVNVNSVTLTTYTNNSLSVNVNGVSLTTIKSENNISLAVPALSLTTWTQVV